MSVVRRPLTYELLPWNFVAMDCMQFPEILPFGNFFSREREIFRDPGKSSPVNIPSTNHILHTVCATYVVNASFSRMFSERLSDTAQYRQN